MTTSVYERIREAIIAGGILPGSSLSEQALATEFGTSRTPVREALHRLEIERLVERSGRGVTVRQVLPEEILDIYEVRTTLEGAAARNAATRATDLDRMKLRSAQQNMRDYAGDDASERARLNRRFHEAVWEASHSLTMTDLLERLNSHLFLSAQTTLAVDERWNAALHEHDELLAAIESHDGDAARRIAEHHMLGARDVRLRLYAKEGDA
jgi:DNA-binding GntR family transcriptional regulator